VCGGGNSNGGAELVTPSLALMLAPQWLTAVDSSGMAEYLLQVRAPLLTACTVQGTGLPAGRRYRAHLVAEGWCRPSEGTHKTMGLTWVPFEEFSISLGTIRRVLKVDRSPPTVRMHVRSGSNAKSCLKTHI
jgi:hypothetical protein